MPTRSQARATTERTHLAVMGPAWRAVGDEQTGDGALGWEAAQEAVGQGFPDIGRQREPIGETAFAADRQRADPPYGVADLDDDSLTGAQLEPSEDGEDREVMPPGRRTPVAAGQQGARLPLSDDPAARRAYAATVDTASASGRLIRPATNKNRSRDRSPVTMLFASAVLDGPPRPARSGQRSDTVITSGSSESPSTPPPFCQKQTRTAARGYRSRQEPKRQRSSSGSGRYSGTAARLSTGCPPTRLSPAHQRDWSWAPNDAVDRSENRTDPL
jgi:hypothetical protein